MSEHADRIETDILVIGAGSAGLSVAAGAVQMGARVVLIEKGRMGGDCLNTGCVPSKALLASAKAAHAVSGMAALGIDAGPATADFQRVHDHVHDVIAGIAPHDSEQRFEELGVTVVKASARFVGRREVEAGGRIVRARRIVLATGSAPAVPPIEGVESVPYLTNETVFDLTERPAHLIVIGAGPIGLEMAQAFRRLGSQVTVLEKFHALPKDDPELAQVVLDRMRAEGVDLREGVDIERLEAVERGVKAHVSGADDGAATIAGSHLLIAAGRRPVVDGLDLESAGIEYGSGGVRTDARLRTSNRRVFAIGDVRGGYQFTHVAGYDAGIVIRNALFRLPAKADYSAVPWVTYTDPELAHVGLTENQARDRYGSAIQVLRTPYEKNDRARAERHTEGLVKVIAHKGRPVGASIAGAAAGELIHLWTLAIGQGIKLSAIAGAISPYPTLSELNKTTAGSSFTDRLFSDRTKKLVRFLLKLG